MKTYTQNIQLIHIWSTNHFTFSVHKIHRENNFGRTMHWNPQQDWSECECAEEQQIWTEKNQNIVYCIDECSLVDSLPSIHSTRIVAAKSDFVSICWTIFKTHISHHWMLSDVNEDQACNMIWKYLPLIWDNNYSKFNAQIPLGCSVLSLSPARRPEYKNENSVLDIIISIETYAHQCIMNKKTVSTSLVHIYPCFLQSAMIESVQTFHRCCVDVVAKWEHTTPVCACN